MRKQWKKRVAVATVATTLLSSNTYQIVEAVRGNINVNINYFGFNFTYPIPAEVFINKGITAEQTVLNQEILEAVNFGKDDKVKQVVVASPAQGGEFKFNASFNIEQAHSIAGRRLWDVLSKRQVSHINSWTGKEGASQMLSYVDLEVSLDDRLEFTDPTGKISSAYFDSFSWRPIFVLSADKQTVLADVRSSYNASGPQKGRLKTFDISTDGAKKFVIRVVPIDGRFTDDELNTDMQFGFDTPGTNNFQVSAQTANAIAQARRNMSEGDIAAEKAILNKTLTNTQLTAQEIATLRAYNIYVAGEVTGNVQASALGVVVNAPINKGSFPPAGIAVTYANPSVEFKYNYKAASEDLYKRVYVDYNGVINQDTLIAYSVPTDPTRDGFSFVGWSTDKNATAENVANSKFDVNQVITENKVVYAIWQQGYKATYNFVSGTAGKTLPSEVTTQLPLEQTGIANQATVTAPTTFTAVDTTEGTWTFGSWNQASQTVNGANVVFEGTWHFTPKTYKATYNFVSANGAELPAGVTAQLPAEQTGIVNQSTVTAPTAFTAVDTAEGTWTFGSWNQASQTVNGANVVFEGTWNFTPKTYKATYNFISANGAELPVGVTAQLPAEQTGIANQATVTAPTTFTAVDTTEGTWTFGSWNQASQTVNGANVVFEGTWHFTPKTYKATYNFVSANGAELPAGVTAQLPAEQTGLVNQATVTAPTAFTAVETTEGTWTFGSWNQASQTVNNADVSFVGTWNFTPKTYKATYSFVSGTTGKVLPTEVTAQLPTEQTGIANQATVTAPTAFTAVDTTEGTWTFDSWDNASQTVNGANVVFEGTWYFTPKMKTTEFVDEEGNKLKDMVVGVEVVEAINIKDYYFLETQNTATGVKHIYVKKEIDIPDAPTEDEKPVIQTTEFVDELGNELKPVVFNEMIFEAEKIVGYEWLRTETTETGVKHVYAKTTNVITVQTSSQFSKSVNKKGKQLPQTGQVSTIGYGLGAIIASIGMLFTKRSKKDKK